ncbi:MAG TPA: HypC/HybG/HupF family hydrogenase formation chaperone [Streptosporangiaceae bacterium]|nr:HypC/HybG/HupF family hydrogenase formation chaperone [Streptosporangiaceae bacterium]
MTDSELAHTAFEHAGIPRACADEVCVTCSDTAVPVTVVTLLAEDLAVVRTPAGHREPAGHDEEVSVALVRAAVGDTVLVHAGEAIAVIRQ